MSGAAPRWTARFRASGAVQGVGFRPFLHRLATAAGLDGWVRNDPDGAEFELTGAPADVDAIVAQLRAELPPPGRIDALARVADGPAVAAAGAGFRIEASRGGRERRAAVLPDLALCDACRRELLDPSNRRYRHPFITCTHCGPRFSIITGLPYDRPQTTMARFPMCPQCRAEYEDPADRRFHAQPIACPDCGPRLAWWDADGHPRAPGEAALAAAAEALRAGQIIAVKGLGGFHLLCDARSEAAVAALRRRKHREAKPLAVMVRDLAMAQVLCEASPAEAALLASPAAPIVLLRRRERDGLAEEVAPEHPYLGTMLAYTPLHLLLLEALGFPVVATSGNHSDEPICTDEQEAVHRLAGIADGFLVHDRPIARPVEDSVVRIAFDRPMLLRRSRGYAPQPLPLPGGSPAPTLAVGGQLKVTVALGRGDEAVIGAHLGDLDTAEARAALDAALRDLPALFGAAPARVCCDLHPDYASTRAAQALGLPLQPVQHHFAHIAAILAEHRVPRDEPVLGVSWDGTGYGTDGTAWGGELLAATRGGFTRFAHLRAFRLPGGDAAAREPRRSAAGLLFALDPADDTAARWFGPGAWPVLRSALARGVRAPWTSSMGRLFDAVAALLGLRTASRYEGEAAMALEFAALGVAAGASGYTFDLRDGVLDWAPAIRALRDDHAAGRPVGEIAADFHRGLALAIVAAARALGHRQVALGGGCFQNVRLLAEAVAALRDAGFIPLWPRDVPPNDGGLSYGQLAAASGIGDGRGDG